MPTQTGSPFLRWAGSKRWLINEVLARRPVRYGRYFEPFLGSGAVFFALRPEKAVLGDAIGPLIDCYRCVKEDHTRVFKHLSGWGVDKESFYSLRSATIQDPFERAAQFIYLNKTAFNGLYRVNKEGRFNVPFGRPKTNRTTTLHDLERAADALECADLRAGDFENTLDGAQEGDLVFLDPPYVAGHRANGFVDYNSRLFDWADQVRLRNVFVDLDRRGINVLLTNAAHSSVRELYAGFAVNEYARHSSMAAATSARGRSAELLVLGATLERNLRG